MAAALENTMKLIGTADGRSKCFKMAEGVFLILASLSRIVNRNCIATMTRTLVVNGAGDLQGEIKVVLSRESQYLHICRSLYTVRCFLRLGKFLRDFFKMRALYQLVHVQGFYYTERKKYWDFARAACSAVYLILDNILILKRYLQPYNTMNILHRLRVAAVSSEALHTGLGPSSSQKLLRYATGFRVGSYGASLAMDTLEMRDSLLRLEYDPPAAKKAIKRNGVALIRDIADLSVTVPQFRAMLRAAHEGTTFRLYAPGTSTVTEGVLLCVSAFCSNWLTWQNVEKSLAP